MTDSANKAHAGLYALMGYRMLQLKQQYPVEYQQALDQLTTSRKEPIMGMTAEEKAEYDAKKAAEAAEQDVDEAQASNDSDEKPE